MNFKLSIFFNEKSKDWRLNLWYLFFVLSKALELVDTLFIVLRKHKLLTLHWVHHCLTLCYSWYAMKMVELARIAFFCSSFL